MSSITLKSHAKINLYLKIVKKRHDGYHEIRTVFSPVELHDTVTVEKKSSGITISCDDEKVPVGAENLVFKAAVLFLSHTGIAGGFNILIRKNIPVGAGLGGGSGNAAAALIALNRLTGSELTSEELQKLASKIGADVPFFIDARPVYATGIGDVFVSPVVLPEMHILLVNPMFEVSTAWAYRNFSTDAEKTVRMNIQNALGSLKTVEDVAGILYNSLEIPVINEYPLIGEIKTALKKSGAEGVLMSGSGPTVFGIFKSPGKAASAMKNIKKEMPDCLVIPTRCGQFPSELI